MINGPKLQKLRMKIKTVFNMILKNMEDVEGNILYYPIILAKNKKIS